MKKSTTSRAKCLISAVLSATMAFSPLLSGCVTQTSSSSVEDDDGKDAEDSSENELNSIKVDYSAQGNYTVAISESNLIKLEADEGEKTPDADEGKAAEEEGGASDEATSEAGAAASDEATSEADAPAASETDAAKPAEIASGEAATSETPAESSNTAAAEQVKFADLKQDAVAVVYEYDPPTQEGTNNSEIELREAKINDFKNENGTMTISMTDPDAAANDTDRYYVVFDGLDACAIVETETKDYALTSKTGSVSCDSDNHTITLEVSGDEFAEGISAKEITLGGSFKDMQVAEVSASGSTLTLKLTGKPTFDTNSSTSYTAGQITIAETGFKGGTQSETAYVDIDTPTATFAVNELKTDGGSTTMPLYVTGIDAESISAGDISFASDAKVTAVKTEGDKLLVTVGTDDVNKLGGQVKVKDHEYLSPVSHAMFDANLDNISNNGEKFEMTLQLTADDGTFAKDLSADKVTLADGFDGGAVTSVKVKDDTNAELSISVPANGKTIDNYDLIGTVTLAQGALVDEWGTAAPEYSYASYYVANDEGKDAGDSGGEEDAAKKQETDAALAEEAQIARRERSSQRTQQIVEYGNKALDFVGGDVAEVGKYCLDIFQVAVSAYTGNYADIVTGLKSIIKRAGLFDGGEDPNAPTAKSVEDDVAELKSLMSMMDQRMDVLENNQYAMLVRGFDNALDALSTDCARAESMLRGAKDIYKQEGKTVPSDNATDEELLAYNHALIDIIEAQEKSGNRAFKNYSTLIARIENNYITTTTEAKKDWNYNPFHYYDKRVANYFNWETQGWYLRETYRSFAKFQITRAYNTLSLYYEIPQNAERYKDLTERLAKSLQTIEDHPAGVSPTDWKEGTPVYSNTLKRSFTKYSVGDTNKKDFYIGDSEVDAYKARLHDKSVQDDLELAFPGIMDIYNSTKGTGIGMGGKWTKSKNRSRSNPSYVSYMANYKKAPWYKRLFMGTVRIPPTRLVKEDIYFERILHWDGDFKSVKTQDKGENIHNLFLIFE